MFDTTDWYWRAADGRIYGSAAQSLVDEEDPAFTAWRGAGNTPTAWPRDETDGQTVEALAAVLMPFGLSMDRTAGKAAAVEARKLERCCAPFGHNFGATAGIRKLDRSTVEEKLAWMIRKANADGLVGQGQGIDLITLRDAAGATFTASAETVAGALSDMVGQHAAIEAHAWTLVNQIEEAPDDAALDAIDIDAGWPS